MYEHSKNRQSQSIYQGKYILNVANEEKLEIVGEIKKSKNINLKLMKVQSHKKSNNTIN